MSYENNYSYNPDYNGPILHWHCRDIDKKYYMITVCDKKLAPEFFILEDERHIAEQTPEIVNISPGPPSNYGEKTLRCTTIFPYQVKKVRKQFTRTFLADVKWIKRCIQSMDLSTPYIEVPDKARYDWIKVKDIQQIPFEEEFKVPIRYVAWDIETDVRKVYPNFEGIEDAKICPIISITAKDSYVNAYHRFYWHPKTKKSVTFNSMDWIRKGDYYVPALKGKRTYNNRDRVINHEFPSEKEMLVSYFNWFNSVKPDAQIGFNSSGGYRITTKSGYSKKYWFNGFDMPYLYKRAEKLGILNEIQLMSPLRKGVRIRTHGDKTQVVIEGVCQVDFLYANEIWKYHEKYNEFREGGLDGYMSFFLGFGKIHHEKQLWELWEDGDKSDYDPSDPNDVGVEKQKNYVKELWENGSMSCMR